MPSTSSAEPSPSTSGLLYIKPDNPMTELHCACGTLFGTKENLKQHETEFHTNPKNFDCPSCDKKYLSLKALKGHVKKIHFQHYRYQCTACGQGMESEKAILIHIATNHGGEKPLSCDRCGKCFAVEEQITRHQAECSKGKNYRCQFCETPFKSESYLQKHMEKHHSFDESRYKCTVCHREYVTEATYINHLNKYRCNLTLKEEAIARGEAAPGLDEEEGEGEIVE